jgi:hypothetical protein
MLQIVAFLFNRKRLEYYMTYLSKRIFFFVFEPVIIFSILFASISCCIHYHHYCLKKTSICVCVYFLKVMINRIQHLFNTIILMKGLQKIIEWSMILSDKSLNLNENNYRTKCIFHNKIISNYFRRSCSSLSRSLWS